MRPQYEAGGTVFEYPLKRFRRGLRSEDQAPRFASHPVQNNLNDSYISCAATRFGKLAAM